MVDNFLKRKKDVLSKKDKSSKGFWDKHIENLCNKINSLENYYTTSSCAGRAVLMIDQDKKEGGLLMEVSHELISFKWLKKSLNKILNSISDCSPQISTSLIYSLPAHPKEKVSICKISGLSKEEKGKIKEKNLLEEKNIKFKMESCALHVACRTLEDAQKLYDKAKLAGWKKSGIISSGSRFMVELTSTEKLEFPIIQKGKLLVDDEFLKIVVEEANKKLERSWEKIEKFEKRA